MERSHWSTLRTTREGLLPHIHTEEDETLYVLEEERFASLCAEYGIYFLAASKSETA